MKNMLHKACEILSMKYDYLKNLTNLKVMELRKIIDLSLLSNGLSDYSQLMRSNN
jgi:hypothetical protein